MALRARSARPRRERFARRLVRFVLDDALVALDTTRSRHGPVGLVVWSGPLPRGGCPARRDRGAARRRAGDGADPRGPGDRGVLDRHVRPRRAAHAGPGAGHGHDPHRGARRRAGLVRDRAPAPRHLDIDRDRAGHASWSSRASGFAPCCAPTTRSRRPSTRVCSRRSPAASRPPGSSSSTSSHARSGDAGRASRGDRRAHALRAVPVAAGDRRRGTPDAGHLGQRLGPVVPRPRQPRRADRPAARGRANRHRPEGARRRDRVRRDHVGGRPAGRHR